MIPKSPGKSAFLYVYTKYTKEILKKMLDFIARCICSVTVFFF